ncbi:MAG: porin family protein [Bacteroidales bacterium]|jgi:outer membrane protein W|nr:porin family protein [Bacteroidales bacterium]
MKRIKTLLIVILAFVSISTYAQFYVGATVGPQIPLGDLSDGGKTGFGLNLSGKYLLNDNMAVGLNLGYNSFKTDLKGITFSFMPITGLFEYHINLDQFTPFIGADLGLYNYGYKIKVEDYNNSDSEIYFGFAPTVGALYNINSDIALTANAKYNFVLTEDDPSSFLGINFGIVYKIK